MVSVHGRCDRPAGRAKAGAATRKVVCVQCGAVEKCDPCSTSLSAPSAECPPRASALCTFVQLARNELDAQHLQEQDSSTECRAVHCGTEAPGSVIMRSRNQC